MAVSINTKVVMIQMVFMKIPLQMGFMYTRLGKVFHGRQLAIRVDEYLLLRACASNGEPLYVNDFLAKAISQEN